MTVRAVRLDDGPAATPGATRPGAGTVEDPSAFLDRLEDLARAGVRSLSEIDAAALDALAAGIARGAGAADLALGEGVDLLARIRGDVRLGYSGVGDLAREELGIPADQARRLRRVAARLRSRPLLRAAVVRGDVTLRKAEVVARAAVGSEEAYWVARARTDTVRRLEQAVRAGPEHAEADWHRLTLRLPPRQAEIVQVALEAAGIVLGPTAPLWKRIGALAMEFLGEHAGRLPDPASPSPPPLPPARSAPAPAPDRPPDVARGGGGDERAGCSDAGLAPPAVSSAGCEPATEGGAATGVRPRTTDAYEILELLAGIVRGRAGEDERLGRACLLVRRFGVWRRGFDAFDVWCAERLGLAPSTVRQRMALERRMQVLPALREALRSGRLSYERARLVGRVARPSDVEARIAEAAGTTCIAYRRRLEAEEHRQMWRAGELRAMVPDDVDELLADALRAARAWRRGLTPGEALVLVALHFIRTWTEAVSRIEDATHEVVLRDEGLCQVPGCSRPADHVHHLDPRSAGGPLEPWNELSLCATHHLVGVHGGMVLISGTAPDGLRFALGERAVAAARA